MGSFWDVVSGKNYRFNMTRLAAHNEVTAALKAFVSGRVPEDFRDFVPEVGSLQRDLFLFFVCANCNADVGVMQSPYWDSVRAANQSSYLHLIASLHAFFNVFYWHMQPSRAAVYIVGVHDMYRKNDRFLESWLKLLPVARECNDLQEVEWRTGCCLYEEITPILGLPRPAADRVKLWTRYAKDIGLHAIELAKERHVTSEEVTQMMNLTGHFGALQQLCEMTFKYFVPANDARIIIPGPSSGPPVRASAPGEAGSGIADLTAAVRLDRKDAAAFYNRGQAYCEVGEWDKAIADLTQAIRLDPTDVSARGERGNAYRFKGDFDKAIADYTEVIRVDPQDALAYCNRGVAYKRKGDNDNAIADYTEAIRLNPQHANTYNLRGDVYVLEGDHDNAVRDYSMALRLDGKNVLAYMGRGNLYAEVGELDKAIADYTEVIRLDPNYARAFCNRGVANTRKGDLDKAVADCTEAIRLDPKSPQGYYNRGNAYYQGGEWDKAITDFTEAIRLNPCDAWAYYGRGGSYVQVDGWDKAIGDLTEAIRLSPANPLAYAGRARVYGVKGDSDKANADWVRAEELGYRH
jgi:tetratricopeptide (TPR) repeat protein